MMTDAVGYIASTLVLLTFMTKDMRLLRTTAILSNVAFIAYGSLGGMTPVLLLHLMLLLAFSIKVATDRIGRP